MSQNRLRQEISRIMKGAGESPFDQQLDQELDVLTGNLRTPQRTEDADQVKQQRERALNASGYLAATAPDIAVNIVRTAYDVAKEERPQNKKAARTWDAANDMLVSLFSYYTEPEEKKKRDE